MGWKYETWTSCSSCRMDVLCSVQLSHMRFVHTRVQQVDVCFWVFISVWSGVVCRSRALRWLSLSLWGVEEPNGVGEERSPQEQESDNSVLLKLLLCQVMALCSGWFGLSMMDRSRFSVHCSTVCQAVQLCTNDRACLPHQFVQLWCVHF